MVYRDDQEALELRLAALEAQARRADQLAARVRELEAENRELVAQLASARAVDTAGPTPDLGRVDGEVYLDPTLERYADAIVAATRAPALASRILSGARPEDVARMLDAARARAAHRHRKFALPDDIKAVARELLPERIVTTTVEDAAADIVETILDITPVP